MTAMETAANDIRPAGEDSRSRFRRWVLVSASGVFFGDKAGHLVMLNQRRFGLDLDARIACIAEICVPRGLEYMVLCRCETCARVMIFDRGRLQADLDRVPAWVFERLGYGTGRDAAEFLARIDRRWRSSGCIPHEIGLCLGYPVKDVLGFMGLVELPCTGSCGWRIYGRPEASLRRSWHFRDARRRAERYLAHAAAPGEKTINNSTLSVSFLRGGSGPPSPPL